MFYSKIITSSMRAFRCIAPLLLVCCYVGAAQEQELVSGSETQTNQSVLLSPEDFGRHRRESRQERIAELGKQLFGNRRPTEQEVARELQILSEAGMRDKFRQRFRDADELQNLFRQERNDRIEGLLSELGLDKAQNPYMAAKSYLAKTEQLIRLLEETGRTK